MIGWSKFTFKFANERGRIFQSTPKRRRFRGNKFRGKYLNITAKQQPQEIVEEEEQNDKELYFIGKPFH